MGWRLPVCEPHERQFHCRLASHDKSLSLSGGYLVRAPFDERDIPASAGQRPSQDNADTAGADDMNLSFHGPP